MFVPATVVFLLQSYLLCLAVDAHVQERHALRKAEVVLEAAAADAVCRGARCVADDVPRIRCVDVALRDTSRRRFSVCSCRGVSHGDLRLVGVGVRSG